MIWPHRVARMIFFLTSDSFFIFTWEPLGPEGPSGNLVSVTAPVSSYDVKSWSHHFRHLISNLFCCYLSKTLLDCPLNPPVVSCGARRAALGKDPTDATLYLVSSKSCVPKSHDERIRLLLLHQRVLVRRGEHCLTFQPYIAALPCRLSLTPQLTQKHDHWAE